MEPSDSPPPLPGSEPASRAELRYRALLRALLGKGQGLLAALRPDRARFLFGGGPQGKVVSTLLDLSASEQELVAELSALSSDLGEKQSIVVVSDRPWAAQVLKELKEGAPASLALYHVAPDGAVLNLASISFTEQRAELRAALKAQTGATLDPTEPAARFYAEMEEAQRNAAQQVGDVQSFAQALSARPVRVTYVLLALYAVMFALTYAFGGLSGNGVLWRLGAEVPERVREGEWWRLLSATVLHGGPFHILMNGLGLWILGPFMERLFGWSRFLVLYVLAGLLGTVCATLLGPTLKIGLSVGASGSLFGLLGASAVLAFRPAGLPALLVADLKKGAVQNLILNVLVSLQPHVDWTAHLGGALMGGLLVLTRIVQPRLHRRGGEQEAAPERGGLAWAIAGVLAGLLLLGCTAMAMIKGQPWLIRDPSSATRVALGTASLSAEVPRVLGTPQLKPLPNGNTQIELGGISADQVLTLRVLLLTLSTIDELRQAWETDLPKLRSFKLADGMSAVGEPQVTEIGGYPALDSRFAFSSGGKMRRMLQLRTRYLLILELQTAPELPADRTIDPKRFLESLREESGTPTVK